MQCTVLTCCQIPHTRPHTLSFRHAFQEKKAGVKKVLGVSKLKSKYEPHEAKRALCNEFDIFLADDRVLPVLPKLLGNQKQAQSIN